MEKNAAPIRNITVFAPDNDRDRSRPNGMSGARARRSSMRAKAASSTAAAPSSDRVLALPQGWVCVPTMA